MHFRVTQRLEAPRQAVFDVISDPRRRMEWQSSLLRVSMDTEGPARLGTRWREVTQGWQQFEMEITAYDAPALWAERGRGRLADAELTVEFREAGVATVVVVDVHIAFKGAFRVLRPLVRRFMPAALARDLVRAGELAQEALFSGAAAV